MEHEDIARCFQEDQIRVCVERAKDAGYEFIGTGSNRAVFGISEDSVIKVSMGGAGDVTTRREVEVWDEAPEDVKESLAPVEDHGDRWVQMPRVDTEDQRSALRDVRDKMRQTHWRCKDTNIRNVGYLEDEAVLFDYGEGCGESGIGKPY